MTPQKHLTASQTTRVAPPPTPAMEAMRRAFIESQMAEIVPPSVSILERLERDHVFSADRYGDKVVFREECDGHFDVHLTKDEVMQLAAELLALAGW